MKTTATRHAEVLDLQIWVAVVPRDPSTEHATNEVLCGSMCARLLRLESSVHWLQLVVYLGTLVAGASSPQRTKQVLLSKYEPGAIKKKQKLHRGRVSSIVNMLFTAKRIRTVYNFRAEPKPRQTTRTITSEADYASVAVR